MPDLLIDAGHRGERGKYETVEVVVADLEALRALTVVPGVRARTGPRGSNDLRGPGQGV